MKRLSTILILILLTVITLQSASAYYVVEKTFQAEAEYHYPILFIPGVMGTILGEDVGGVVADESWPGVPHENRMELALKDNGKDPVIKGTKIIPYATVRKVWYYEPVYDGFFTFMDSNSRYTYRGEKNGVGFLGKAYFDHPYDFRLDTEQHLKNGEYSLKKRVDEILKETKSDKIILMAHSMGGLQARMFAEKYPNKVAGIVFLSNPHNGAPRGFESVTQGYNFGAGLLVSEEHVWQIGHNWPGIYHLMPNKPFVKKDNVTLSLEQTYTGDYISYQQSLNIDDAFMKNLYKKGITDPDEVTKAVIKEYGALSDKIVSRTNDFRADFDSITLNKNIPFVLINGFNQTTTSEFTVTEEEVIRFYDVGETVPGERGRQIPTKTAMRFTIWNFNQVNDKLGDETVDAHGLNWNKAKTIHQISASHMKIPSNRDAMILAMDFVEEINHDERDRRWLNRIEGQIADKMLDLSEKTQEQLAAESKEYALRIRAAGNGDNANNRGYVSKLYNDLKSRGSSAFFKTLIEDQQFNVQITVPGAGDYPDEPDFNAWIAFDGYYMLDSGIGEVKPVSYKVTMTEEDFLDLVEGDLTLSQAWHQDKIKAGLKVWFVEWVASWVVRFQK